MPTTNVLVTPSKSGDSFSELLLMLVLLLLRLQRAVLLLFVLPTIQMLVALIMQPSLLLGTLIFSRSTMTRSLPLVLRLGTLVFLLICPSPFLFAIQRSSSMVQPLTMYLLNLSSSSGLAVHLPVQLPLYGDLGLLKLGLLLKMLFLIESVHRYKP